MKLSTPVVTFAALATFAFSVQAAKPFTLKDGRRLRMPVERTNSDITRDGTLVAFVMSSRENAPDPGPFNYSKTGVTLEAGDENWICDTVKDEIWRLSDDREFAFAPRWSPDSTKLAYYSDRGGKPRLWIWNRASRTSRVANDRIVRTTYGFELPEWSDDNRYVYFKSLSKEFERFYTKTNANCFFAPFIPREEDADSFALDDSVVEVQQSPPPRKTAKSEEVTAGATIGSEQGIFDLVRHDDIENSVQNVFSRIPMRDFDLSPDGQWVVATTVVGDEDTSSLQLLHRCLVAPAKSPKPPTARELVPSYRESYGVSTSWSPDSKRVAFITSGSAAKGDLQVVALQSGNGRNVTAHFETKLTKGDNQQRPLWNHEGTKLYFPIDGDLWEFAVDGSEKTNLTKNYAPNIVGVVAECQVTTFWQSRGNLYCQFHDRRKTKWDSAS